MFDFKYNVTCKLLTSVLKTLNSYFCGTELVYRSSSMTNTTWRFTWSLNQHWCRLAEGGFYRPQPLQGYWFGMALTVADPPRGHANTLEVDKERG